MCFFVSLVHSGREDVALLSLYFIVFIPWDLQEFQDVLVGRTYRN